MDLKSQLSKIIKGEIFDDDKTLTFYSHDASLFEIKPSLVIWPKDTSDIINIIKFINSNPEKKLTITARLAGTDMTGGPLTDSIVLDFSKHFNKIHQIGSDFAITDPGVFYRNFEKETLKHDLLLPPYPASREICTVGGMAANNSGGEKTLTYGKTEDYIQSLKVILSDGNEYTLSPLTKPELDKKMAQKDFEGKIYSSLYKLITTNYELITKSKPDVSKNSAGYFLWNVWDGKTFDLCKLFCGSQGTLGIITQIKYKLIKPKKHSKLLVIFLRDLNNLAEITNQVLEFHPESFESYDDHTLKLAIRYFPEILKSIKPKSLLTLIWQFIPEMIMTITGGFPKLVLLTEFTGDSEEEVTQKAQNAYQNLEKFSLKMRITQSRQEARKYWVIRRESFNLLRKHLQGKRTAPFIDDLIVKPEYLPEFLPKLNKLLEGYPLIYTVAGHIGDGNFHIIPLMNLSDKHNRQIIPELSKKVYDLVFEYHGSMTAEHNDGLIRSPFLKQMYGEKIWELFKEVKKIFDPNDIFNPHKKADAEMDYSLSHIVTKT